MGMSASAALIATKLLNLHPHEATVIYELCDTDCEGRVHFMNWYLHAVLDREIGCILILFNNEACFCLSGYINSRNNRYQLAVNLMLIHDVPLHDMKVGVWCAVGATRIIGCTFFVRACVHTDVLHSATFFDHLSNYERTLCLFR
jgi:hypothetical protein